MKVKLNDRVLEFPPALHRVPPARRLPPSTAASRRRACGARCNAAHAVPRRRRNYSLLSGLWWTVGQLEIGPHSVSQTRKKNTRQWSKFWGELADCLGQANHVKLLLLTYVLAYEHTLMYML